MFCNLLWSVDWNEEDSFDLSNSCYKKGLDDLKPTKHK